MARFTTTVRTDDVFDADPADVWSVMQDPDALADLAPTVASITTDGDRWCWRLVGISALGVSAAPSFTERMRYDHDDRRIDFAHDPPAGKSEAAGASGTYHLREVDAGTYVAIELTAHVDLPLPSMMGGAVRRVMDRAIVLGGQRFADNLLRHLGVTESRGMEVVAHDVPFPRTPDRTP
ncbi:SRPBCC family protein [Euzebya sp.]|uniref:SRPBCC family protein n=1 Tax=Euzebya sp. TaxID=1971409 RepID=UPI00351190EB